MTTEIEKAQQMIVNLAQQVAQLRSENSHLRRSTSGKHPYHYNTAGRILRRSLDDSIAFITLASNGYPTSRQFFYELGYSERRYYWAIGLLRSARVMAPRGRALLVGDFITADSKLHAKYNTLKQHPNVLEMLRVYMPKKMGSAYHGHRRT